MRKQSIYAGILLAAIGFSACNDDFKDWAAPQSNSQLDAAAQVVVTFKAGKDAAIVMDELAGVDSVEIAQIASSTAEEGSTYALRSLVINESYTVPYAFKEGNIVKVKLAQLDSVAQEAYRSRASVLRELKLKLTASAITPSGEGLMSEANEVAITLTPGSTPAVDPDGYYVVRGTSSPILMTQKSEGLYVLSFDDMGENETFKIYPAAAINGGAVIDETKALGVADEEGNMNDNFIVWSDVKPIKSTFAGKVKITLDIVNYRFTVEDNNAATEMYMTGDLYNWGNTATDWIQLTPVGDTKGAFWGIYYFKAGEKIKFAPQTTWDSSIGYSAVSDESMQLAGLSTDNDQNIIFGNPGWYLVYLSSIGNTNVIEIEIPKVYLMGVASVGIWSVSEEDLFTVPEGEDGEFVSPVLTKATTEDGGIRICARPSALSDGDWWKTEFIINDEGKILYRGNGGEQNILLQAVVGSKVYLNFKNNTGRVSNP